MAVVREWSFGGTTGQIAARTWSDRSAVPTHIVLLAHGYGEHAGRYGHVADALVSSGAVVYAVDHLGHGKSEGEPALVGDFEQVVSDLHLLDQTARVEHPGLPVALIGHSMGGLIAARYAQRYGDTLACLVLSGPLIGQFPAAGAMLAMEAIPDVPLDIATLSRDPQVGAAYAADPLVWHGPFKRPTLEAIVTGIEAVQSGPSLGALPLLWVHGVADPLVAMEGSRLGIDHLRGEVFEQQLYDGARHEVFNETNSDQVLADVTDFLRRNVSPRPRRPAPAPG